RDLLGDAGTAGSGLLAFVPPWMGQPGLWNWWYRQRRLPLPQVRRCPLELELPQQELSGPGALRHAVRVASEPAGALAPSPVPNILRRYLPAGAMPAPALQPVQAFQLSPGCSPGL